MELDNFIKFIQELTQEFTNNQKITDFVNNWQKLRTQVANDPNQLKNIALQQLENYKSIMPKLSQFSEKEIEIIKLYHLDKFMGDSGIFHIKSLQGQIQSNINNAQNVMQSFITELNQSKNKPNQLLSLLQPLLITSTEIDIKEGIIEIIFDGKVKISNITEGKDQFSDWFLIIGGYAHIFDIRREDFEILSISKSSPTKIKLKVKVEIAAAILSVFSSILTIEHQYASDRIMVEQLKKRSLVSDSLQQQFLQEAEERLSKNVEREIDRIVDQKVQERKIDIKSQGDIVSSFQKGVEKQYNFIINGGDVKFYLGDEAEKQKAEELESSKLEIKLLKEKLENIKALNDINPKSDSTDNNSVRNGLKLGITLAGYQQQFGKFGRESSFN